MNRRTSLMIWIALGAVVVLHGTFEAAAADVEGAESSEATQIVRIDLSAEEVCNQASWFPVAVHPALGPAGCVSTLDSGGFVWLNLPQEPLQETRLRTAFLVPSGPLPGVTPFGLQQIDHVLIAYLFEQQGIAVALIADNAEVPAPPSFIEGKIAGVIEYAVPFEVIVHTRMQRHRLTVRQDGEIIASAAVEKADPHAEPFMFAMYVNAPGSIQGLDWFFGDATFKGRRLGSGTFPSGPVLGGLWAVRVGDAIRVTNPY